MDLVCSQCYEDELGQVLGQVLDKLVSQPRIKMDCEAQELILQELKEQRELLDEFHSEMAGLSTFEMVMITLLTSLLFVTMVGGGYYKLRFDNLNQNYRSHTEQFDNLSEIFEEEKKIQAKNQANIKRQLKDLKKKGFEGKERN